MTPEIPQIARGCRKTHHSSFKYLLVERFSVKLVLFLLLFLTFLDRLHVTGQVKLITNGGGLTWHLSNPGNWVMQDLLVYWMGLELMSIENVHTQFTHRTKSSLKTTRLI